jgi:hypothetical protein
MHIVGGREVEDRRGLRDAGGDGVERGGRLVRQEDDTCLGAQLHHVPRAIVFLVAPRPLVLLDDVLFVFVDGEAAGKAGLRVPAHSQPIQIQRRLGFDDERRLTPQRVEVLPARARRRRSSTDRCRAADRSRRA